MKHTPGPWNHFIWDASKPHLRTIGAPHKPGGADHVVTYEISEADAALIAAAPELLQALKLCVRELCQNETANEPGSGMDRGLQRALKKAFKVIDKAEGKS